MSLLLFYVVYAGTIFLELWKRYNARLSYEWDVDQFEQNEPDRPEFFGTKLKKVIMTQKATKINS
jgi:anoctamin-5